ncbi:MAG: flagellin [Candidatus Poseidoniales archaeon]
MSLTITTNPAASQASMHLAKNNLMFQRSISRLASGKKISSGADDPGGLAVSMKLKASYNRLAGAYNNVQNGMSFLEVQDGLLDSAGKILDRMSELKGLATQDPMKSAQDQDSYNNEFKDLQVQLYQIGQMNFNGVSLFASTSNDGSSITFSSSTTNWNTLSIHTSTRGSTGPKISIHKAALQAALTLNTNTMAGGTWSSTMNSGITSQSTATDVTFAADEVANALSVDAVSVGVITKVLENIAYLRAQNGGGMSRLSFQLDSIAMQKTNMQSAISRVVDVDMAAETTNLAKYSILTQASAAVLSQANANMDVALMLLR